MKKLILAVFILMFTGFASAAEWNEASLKWDASPGQVDGYTVYSSIDGVTFGKKIDVGNVTTLFNIDTAFNLYPGRNYFFLVRAYNAKNESGDSNVVTYTAPVHVNSADNIYTETIEIPDPPKTLTTTTTTVTTTETTTIVTEE